MVFFTAAKDTDTLNFIIIICPLQLGSRKLYSVNLRFLFPPGLLLSARGRANGCQEIGVQGYLVLGCH